MMKRTLTAMLALLIAAGALLAACGPGATGGGEDRLERHLRLPFPLPHTTIFNVHEIANEYDMHRLLSANLYHRVLCPDLQWTVWVPDLAVDVPQQMDDQGLVWRIEITPGHTFDDGRVIDAHVFEFSQRALVNPTLLNRNQNSPALVGLADYFRGEIPWEEVTGFRVIDDYTIEITYIYEMRPQYGVPDVMERLGWMGTSVVHPEIFEANWNEDRTINTWGTTPWPENFMASGVYRVSQYITDQYIQFEKRDAGASPIEHKFTADRISFVIAPEEDTQMMLFESGQLDQARANARRFDDYPDLFHYANGFIYGIFLNPFSEANPILQDVNFRRALYWSLDRERIVRAAFPIAMPQAYLYPQTTRMRAADYRESGVRVSYRQSEQAASVTINGHELTQFGFEPERALAYFDLAWEANGRNPIVMEMIYSDGGEAEQIWAEAIQEGWQNLFGADRFQIVLRATPWAVALENHLFRTAMDYEIVATRRIWQVLDGEAWWNTNWIGDGHPFSYPTQYCVLTPAAQAEFDRLFDTAFHDIYNQDLRNWTNAWTEELILNDHTFLPMYNHRDRLIISPWLTSIIPEGHFDFRAGAFQFLWDDEMFAANQ
ncbi:MAG: ABC transporter substrate-binding protein [Defluviitaleaceae bacterium]|nr:ABC transporter substrate-binding protein [Defluviitaleaceae bacterium]